MRNWPHCVSVLSTPHIDVQDSYESKASAKQTKINDGMYNGDV